MINLLGLWLILYAVVVGWGALLIWAVRSLAPRGFIGALSTCQTMWLGYAGLVAFLQLISLVIPMGEIAIGLSILPALGGYAVQREVIARRFAALRRRPRQTGTRAVVVVLTAIVVGYASWNVVDLYDTGLYHLQAVKWFSRYPVVPGLSNLHGRFGYNNSVHLFAAYADAYWQGVTVHVTNGFLLLAILCQWFMGILDARTPRARLRQVYCLLTLPLVLSKLWGFEVASLSSDLPNTVLSTVLVLELLSLPRGSRERSRLSLLLVLAIAGVTATTKLGGLSLFAVSLLVACVVEFRHSTWRIRIALLGLPCLLFLGWLARGVIMSGWLVYPVFGKLPVDWAVPSALAHDDLANIRSWSRMSGRPPSEVLDHGFWHWFTPWLDAFRMTREFALLIISLALCSWRSATGPADSAARRVGEWGAVAACSFGILQWFWGAPDLRYGGFLFWLLPAVLLAPMLSGAMRTPSTRALVLVLSLAATNWAGGYAFRLDVTVPKLWGRPPAPRRVPTHLVVTSDGTEVRAPDEGDQCWDAELPCTPLVSHQALRDRGDLASGYLPTP